MSIATLGECKFASPYQRTVSDSARVPAHIIQDGPGQPDPQLYFELAGPRPKLFFDPPRARAGIVTCGGLCPGLNNVIRSLFLEMHHRYGLTQVLGFRGGYQGLDPARGEPPTLLNCDYVDDIHQEGGTVLDTSRGPVDTKLAVDNLIRLGVDILFTIGGDGTQRGGNDLYLESRRRGHNLAVVGIPKTVDNDVAFVARTFGFQTAVEEAARVLGCAHTEAHSVQNGIALVKLMGRDAGFIAAGATIASQDVNFTLIPEEPFKLEGDTGFLAALEKRVLRRKHAVIVVAEGAGQDLLAAEAGLRQECDASGNAKLQDIGPFLRQKIEAHFKSRKIPVTLRYIDPSYLIRSVKADAEDAVLCDLFARNAVHAAMAGKTGLVIGCLHDLFIHLPITMLASQRKRIDPAEQLWQAVLASTGQPPRFF